MAKGKKATSIDMTEGSPYRLILVFTLPLLLGNIFQQLYNMVDSVVVGNVIGDQALAAVGTGFPIIFMLCSLFMGVGTGATIMISQFYGARDLEKVNQTVNTIYTAMIVSIIPLSLIGVIFSEPMLRAMNVPDDGTLQMAKTYMIIIFIGIIGTLGYNINAGILQGLGDSRTSLLFLMIATAINIVLDLVLTIVIEMGVAGVALATIIAQIASWLFGVFYINKRYDFVQIKPQKFYFDKRLFWQAMKLGIPSGIQQALFSIGIMFMQSLVNSYGSNFMAGFNGANKIDTFAFLPVQSLSNALTTYTGQNIGAGQLERVKKGYRIAFLLMAVFSFTMLPLAQFFGNPIMRLFVSEPEVIEMGAHALKLTSWFYLPLGMIYITRGLLNGAGDAAFAFMNGIIEMMGRICFAKPLTLIPQVGVWGVWLATAFTWLLTGVLTFLRYLQGKWKKHVTPKETRQEELVEV